MSDASFFLIAASVPRDESHMSGDLSRAQTLLKDHPEIAGDSIYTAAVLGDDATVRRFINADSSAATRKGGPHEWDALTYLCFSRYLRLEPERSASFVATARSLLDAGANPNSGWWEKNHQPKPEWESALYGAAGIAHDPDLTRLLVDRGAEVNDEEVIYHTPEAYDNRALEVIVESGRLTPDSLAVMLLRKHDWHDHKGVVFLLEHGADPNWMTHWRMTPLHQAIQRDNDIEIIKAALDHGGDPNFPRHPISPLSVAVRRGRSDVLKELAVRGIPIELEGVERLIAACAMDDAEAIRTLTESEPDLVRQVRAQGGTLLAEFAGVGNKEGVGHLLDLGIGIGERYQHGDGYYGIARDSTALHVAAWRARHETVRLLIERGATVEIADGGGRTPLILAVKACVDSYWAERRSPDSVKMLLDAGATPNGIPLPTGYAEIDSLLEAAQ
jgi:hypothetical protein